MIKVSGEKKIEMKIDRNMKISEIEKQLGISDDSYMVVVNGKPCMNDEEISDKDDVVFLEVFSGG
ncbi:MAG: MoaD/ThiS family protein [Thermoplasmata archaeon]